MRVSECADRKLSTGDGVAAVADDDDDDDASLAVLAVARCTTRWREHV